MENIINLKKYIDDNENILKSKDINKLVSLTKLRYNEGQKIKMIINDEIKIRKIRYNINEVEAVFKTLESKYNNELKNNNNIDEVKLKNKYKIHNINLYYNKIKKRKIQDKKNQYSALLSKINRDLKRFKKNANEGISERKKIKYEKMEKEQKEISENLKKNKKEIKKTINKINGIKHIKEWEKNKYDRNDLINFINNKKPTIKENVKELNKLKFTDNFRGFKMFNYKLSNIKTLIDFYDRIKELTPEKEKYKYTYNLIFFNKNNISDKRFITIKPVNSINYNRFVDYIEKLNKGEINKSDVLDIEKYEIDFNHVQLKRYAVEAKGSAKFNFCDVEEAKGDKNKCLKNCLNKYFKCDEEIKNISQAEYISEKNNFNLIVYADYPNIKLNFLEEDKYIEIGGDIYKEVIFNDLKILSHNKIVDNKTIALVYKDNHVAIFKGNKKNLYICPNLKLYEYNKEENLMKLISKRTELYDNNPDIKIEDKKYDITYVTFDLETIFNIKKRLMLEPYSISYTINENHKYEAGVIFGDNCVKEFIQKLYKEQKNRLYVLIGYNSSNFDNYFLIEHIAAVDWLNSIFHNNSSVLNIKFGGRHCCFDLNKFTLSSLKNACENYKTHYKKIGDFDHWEIQKYFNDNNGEIKTFFHNKGCKVDNFNINWPGMFKSGDDADIGGEFILNNILPCKCENIKKLIKYNLYDVLSTYEIYKSIEEILKQNNLLDKREFFDYKTIGSLIFNLFKKDVTMYNIKNKKNITQKELNNIKPILPLLPLEECKLIRSGLVAGRTQCFKDVFYDLSGENKYYMIDVKSLYPFVMLNKKYPCGSVLKLNFNECNKRGLIGFYKCSFDQKNLKKNILPKRGAVLDWNYKGEQTLYLNTIDINMLIKYNCNVKIIRDKNNFCFSHTTKGENLFKCTSDFKKIKEKQDEYKKTINLYEGGENNISDNDYNLAVKEYNPALRQMAKIFLNSLSGKVIERTHTKKTKIVRNKKEYDDIVNNTDFDNIDIVQILNENNALIEYEISEDEALKEGNKPLYLGVIIYAYARAHMYDTIIYKYDVLYMDTDSGVLIESEYKRLLKENPELMGSDFGKYELEDFHKNNTCCKFVTLAPKNYFMLNDNNNPLKKGFKSVNLNSDIILNDDDLNKYFIHETKRDKKKYYDINNDNKINFDLYHFILSPQKLNKKDNIMNFINQIHKKGFAYIMRSKLLKIKRDMKNKKGGCLYQNYELCKIDIRKKENKPTTNKKYIL